MSATRLRPRDRRALLLGAALLLPILLFGLVGRPYLHALSTTRAELQTQRELLARERTLLEEARAYPARMDDAEAGLRLEVPRLFGGTDELTMTAALAEVVAEEARRSRVLVQGIESREAAPVDEGVLALQVELRALGDLEGVLTFLHALEQGEKLIRVERLAIERAARYERSAAPEEQVLALTASLRGFALRPTRVSAGATAAREGEN